MKRCMRVALQSTSPRPSTYGFERFLSLAWAALIKHFQSQMMIPFYLRMNCSRESPKVTWIYNGDSKLLGEMRSRGHSQGHGLSRQMMLFRPRVGNPHLALRQDTLSLIFQQQAVRSCHPSGEPFQYQHAGQHILAASSPALKQAVILARRHPSPRRSCC